MTVPTTRNYTDNIVTLKIKRPCGKIEVIDVSDKFMSMNEQRFERIKKATRQAGKGEVLSYNVEKVEKTYSYTDEEMAERRYEEGMRVAGFSEFGQSGTY